MFWPYSEIEKKFANGAIERKVWEFIVLGITSHRSAAVRSGRRVRPLDPLEINNKQYMSLVKSFVTPCCYQIKCWMTHFQLDNNILLYYILYMYTYIRSRTVR